MEMKIASNSHLHNCWGFCNFSRSVVTVIRKIKRVLTCMKFNRYFMSNNEGARSRERKSAHA